VRPWLLALLVLALLHLGLYTLLTPAAAPSQPTAVRPTSIVEMPPQPTAAPPAPEAATTILAPATFAAPVSLDAGRALLPADGADIGADWLVLAGDWQAENGSLVQRDTTRYDRIISYRPAFADYTLRLVFRHRSGSGGGVLFNMPQPERRNGAQMVRYADDGSALFWGYFDADGDFVGQGSARVPAPGTAAHTLEIRNDGIRATIVLDGATIAQDVPLVSRSGSVGLVASQSAVAFDELTLRPQGAAAPAAALPDLNFLSGSWVREGDTVRQLDQAATDFVSTTGIAAERYTLRTTIVLPDNAALSDVGAGVLFHMPAQESLNGAQMVRFGSAGRELFWGTFSAAGVFQGQGQADLEPASGQPRTLTLIVDTDTYTILVDDTPIAAGVPLQNSSGWIGLLSFRGPVSFQDISLTLGTEPTGGTAQ
jgi:hypothetical protein